MEEYIKKSEALSKAKYYETGLTTGFEYVTTEDLNSLPTYSFPSPSDEDKKIGDLTLFELKEKGFTVYISPSLTNI